MQITETDREDLRFAKQLLETPTFAAKLATVMGSPLERAWGMIPGPLSDMVQQATRKAILQALEAAVLTMDQKHHGPAYQFLHKVAAATSGAVGGAFGWVSLPVELPISTLIILRSIADIARSQGEDVRTADCQVACLEVFALGDRPAVDAAGETGYYAVRATLATAVSEAARYISEKGLTEGAPAIVRLIASIASRFGIVVSQKAAAQAVPAIGAAGGALVNTIFIAHFQDMARGHFVVRRLERTYGVDVVRVAYQEL